MVGGRLGSFAVGGGIMGANEDALHEWIDKLAIRELIERGMRYIDDQAGPRLAELFADDGVMQLAGIVMDREGIKAIGGGTVRSEWTKPGELLKQPGGTHLSSNPVIEIQGDTATAETDMVVLNRDESGRARITLVARYRDRLRRAEDGRWLITNRTGVSIARPGDEGTDSEWARALARMPEEMRGKFRVE
jgi:hypothetical protein